VLAILSVLVHMPIACAQNPSTAVAGATGGNELTIAQNGRTTAEIVVAPDSGTWERRAADDLAKYIEMMTGARPNIVTAASGNGPAFIIGSAALQADARLQNELNKVVKKNPVIRADAIVVRRDGNRVLLAGSNDESHYFAVSYLLQQWGCRWYLPTDFGECVPNVSTLKIGALDHAYAPPFEIRHYWLLWNGDNTGANEFRRRNFMTETSMVGMGHALGQYTKSLVPAGKSLFSVSFADPKPPKLSPSKSVRSTPARASRSPSKTVTTSTILRRIRRSLPNTISTRSSPRSPMLC
jgi:hypothetical protein